MVYNHVICSWLLGFAIASKIPSMACRDVELQSIGTVLHNLGRATTQPLISKGKLFEINGANATRAFIQQEGVAQEWDRHRLGAWSYYPRLDLSLGRKRMKSQHPAMAYCLTLAGQYSRMGDI